MMPPSLRISSGLRNVGEPPPGGAYDEVDIQKTGHALQGQLRERRRCNRRARVDVDDHLDAAGVARIDAHAHDAADLYSEIAHRRTARKAGVRPRRASYFATTSPRS